MSVTLYSKPNCSGCFSTELRFKKWGIDAQKVMVNENPEAFAFIQSLGYSSVPVVVVENEGEVVDHWSSFREERIKGLVA